MNYYIIAAAALSLVALATILYFAFYHSSPESQCTHECCGSKGCTVKVSTLSKYVAPTQNEGLNNVGFFIDSTVLENLSRIIPHVALFREQNFIKNAHANFMPLHRESLQELYPNSPRIEILDDTPEEDQSAIQLAITA